GIAAVDRDRRSVAELPLVVDGLEGALGRTIDLAAVAGRHGGVELDVGWWHGDCTPWNMLARAGRTYLWDWEFAAPDRPVGFDLLHHRFERLRRRPGVDPAHALDALLIEVDAVLDEAGVAADASVRAATVDLYLCELLARELTLEGQRWSGGTMALLGPALVERIERRLAT
ncbi:MAG: hypothetical protein AAGK32_00535, partial [Actinomycetota bacterium]